MSKRRRVDSKEVGLLAGLYVVNYFVDAHDLHYGYWDEGLNVHVRNLPRAQDAYSEFLISQIPQGTRRILDVGMGAGKLAWQLRDRGFDVEGVSPSGLLTQHARERLGTDFKIHEGRFEDVDLPGSYDLVLFSESYQYIDLPTTFAKPLSVLGPGGHILICDFFKRDVSGKSVVGGGHALSGFLEELKRHPLEIVTDLDITAQTAPNLDLVGDMGERLMRPLGELAVYTMEHNYPRLWRLLRWRYRRKLEKLRWKYTSGERSAASFAKHKTYRLFLLRHVS
jgi:SAM-dependent methyltransferase